MCRDVFVVADADEFIPTELNDSQISELADMLDAVPSHTPHAAEADEDMVWPAHSGASEPTEEEQLAEMGAVEEVAVEEGEEEGGMTADQLETLARQLRTAPTASYPSGGEIMGRPTQGLGGIMGGLSGVQMDELMAALNSHEL